MIASPFKEPEAELFVTRTEVKLILLALDFMVEKVKFDESEFLGIVLDMRNRLSEILGDSFPKTLSILESSQGCRLEVK